MLEHALAMVAHLLRSGAESAGVTRTSDAVVVSATFFGKDHAAASAKAIRHIPCGEGFYRLDRDCSRVRRNTSIRIVVREGLRRVV